MSVLTGTEISHFNDQTKTSAETVYTTLLLTCKKEKEKRNGVNIVGVFQ